MFWRSRQPTKLKTALAVVALGLLIWTRLRLVSSIPRTVYADPPMPGTPTGQVQEPCGTPPAPAPLPPAAR